MIESNCICVQTVQNTHQNNILRCCHRCCCCHRPITKMAKIPAIENVNVCTKFVKSGVRTYTQNNTWKYNNGAVCTHPFFEQNSLTCACYKLAAFWKHSNVKTIVWPEHTHTHSTYIHRILCHFVLFQTEQYRFKSVYKHCKHKYFYIAYKIVGNIMYTFRVRKSEYERPITKWTRIVWYTISTLQSIRENGKWFLQRQNHHTNVVSHQTLQYTCMGLCVS